MPLPQRQGGQKEDLLGLPDIVSGFNGFYGKHGVYILEDQNRVLVAFAAALIALLVAAGFGVGALIRRRQRVARAKPGTALEPPR